MEPSEAKVREYIRRLLLSRMRLLSVNGFYGLLLMHMGFALDENCGTAATNGKKIVFDPKFLDEISDSELDFIMMHEILHVVLQHCMRTGDRDNDLFNIACDIVVNSNILKSLDMDEEKITVLGDASMHLTPDGDEGYLYTAEQVYEMLLSRAGISGGGVGGSQTGTSGGNAGTSTSSQSGGKPNSRGRGKSNGAGSRQTGASGGGAGTQNHGGDRQGTDPQKCNPGTFRDNHSRWGEENLERKDIDLWVIRIQDACTAMEIRDPSNTQGRIPVCALRIMKALRNPQTDWRTILVDFIQQEITDYSFTPPDRRFNDGDFFLPDFNEKEDYAEDILFMVDTSGSMSDDMITAAFSEIKGAIDAFDGRLKGWLGFFDTAVVEPQEFDEVSDILKIKPAGGGGTNFHIIFRYVQQYMQEKLPACIIILTDGYADFPQEVAAMGIPVLWLINNEEVTPPWGKIARIEL